MDFALENCTNYVDVTGETIIVTILLYAAFIAVWVIPVYLLRERGLVIKLQWIFLWGLILNFVHSMNALSLSQPFCNQGQNTDILNSVYKYANIFIDLYATLIQPLLLITIVILVFLRFAKNIYSRLKK